MIKRSRSRSKNAIEFARDQRRTSNEFAATVWQWLRGCQIDGAKFRREYPIAPYTVDFCCVERKLIIEIDGEGHLTEEGLEHDRVRDQFLRAQGFKVLRIPGYVVIREGGNAIQTIRDFVQALGAAESPSPPAPLPFVPQGRGEPEY
jgi:very-short-patch-repair endonuclease